MFDVLYLRVNCERTLSASLFNSIYNPFVIIPWLVDYVNIMVVHEKWWTEEKWLETGSTSVAEGIVETGSTSVAEGSGNWFYFCCWR